MIWLFTTAVAFAAPLDADVLYFILVDRFSNGEPKNDSTIDASDLQAFHGGDLQGITKNLDYLEKIGVDAIWLSPIFSMRDTKFHGHGAFHGYWTHNLDDIEPRFGGSGHVQRDGVTGTYEKCYLNPVWRWTSQLLTILL